MSCVEGFVLAASTANKQTFLDHAKTARAVFLERGTVRARECWGHDSKDGKQTGFQRAVQARDDETVCFSRVEWPDKWARDAAMARTGEMMTDPRMDPEKNSILFDGKRTIFGGCVPVVELGGS